MKNTPHELHEEFPDLVEQMSRLKVENAHFAKLFDAYHEVNRDVHRAETDIEPMSDEHVADLRRKRMVLKDELYLMLTQS